MDMNSHIFISICHSTFLFFLLMMWFLGSTITASNSSVKCIKMEREALLAFKDGLTDPSARLSSWVGDDCCMWRGVTCDNATGHVFNLNLKNPSPFLSHYYDGYDDYYFINDFKSCLGGEVNPSLVGLKYLKYLDLSFNDFNGTHIPKFLGSLHYLTYLNLSYANFSGEIPPHLGNLTSLHYLDLNGESLFRPVQLHAENLWWLSGLSSLEYLNLGSVNLSGVGSDWLHAVNMLPSLLELHLPRCQLETLPPSFSSINFTSLSVLDMSGNWYSSPSNIPHWLFNLTRLTALDLSYNQFHGSIPGEIGNLTFLQHLDLSFNYMEGHIPRNLGKLCKLKVLDLSGNELSGDIKELLGGFSGCPQNSLLSLNLGINKLVGYLPESLGRLENLKFLDLSWNSLVGNLPHSLWNLSYLQKLHLSGNQLTGSIPASIGNLSHLQVLDLSENQMNGSIPESIGQLSELVYLNLQLNSWQGVLTEAHFLNLTRLEYLYISSSAKSLRFNMRNEWVFPSSSLTDISLEDCQVGPKFPVWLRNHGQLSYIKLTNVGISESITSLVYNKSEVRYVGYPAKMTIVTKGREYEYGKTLAYVNSIDISHNHLEGEIPDGITSLSALGILNLSMNHLTGSIPENIGNLRWLETFDLSNNTLSGPIPPSISSLTSLNHFNLSYNNLTGRIPSGNQLQTLNDSSIYQGNPFLCGVPLPTKCPGDETSGGQKPTEDNKDEDKSEMFWFYISIGPGFVVGFWCVFGTLLVKRTWRRAYFEFVEDVGEWIALMLVLKVAALRRKLGFEHN